MFLAGRADGSRGSQQAVQVRGPEHCSASQGPRGPPSATPGQPWSLREKHLLRLLMASGGDAIEGSKARSGTKKRAFVSLQPMGLCCINQLSQEPNTIKPKQSPRLGGITLMYIHWVMPHLWEGTPEGRRGKMSMAHQCARASSTGGQGGQLHFVAAFQPSQRSSGQGPGKSVLTGEG